MFDSLRKLLGIAGQIGGGVIENAQKSFNNALDIQKPGRASQAPNRPLQKGGPVNYMGSEPAATMQYQPNNTPTNWPWATNTPIPSHMGQQYMQNPYDPQFVGPNAIDPKVFGYGPDNLSQR